MDKTTDWYPMTREGERTLYGNLDSKIDGYKTKYPFLTGDFVTRIHTMCQTFTGIFDKLAQNRATARQMTGWFDDIVSSKQKDQPVPPAPVFQAFAIPSGATVGIEQQCREFARLMKNQPNYDVADGLDLMIEKEKGDDFAVGDAMPELKISATDSAVRIIWKKTGFDALELQYRKQNAPMWQAADKSTVNEFDFAPPLTTPGVPEKFEFRAVYLIKNQRVGNWSPVYTETIG